MADQDYSTPMLSDNFVSRARSRQTYLAKVRRSAEDTWEEIIDLLLPSSTPFITTGLEGVETGKDIYLSDPVRYLRTSADGAMGGMVSQHFRWFAYQMDDLELRRDDEVRKWLQACDDTMYFAFGKSNLYGVVPPHFRYALSIGNSVLLKHEDVRSGRLVFTCPHPRESYWLEDVYGRALPYHRLYSKTVADVLEQFPNTQDPTYRARFMSVAFDSAVEARELYRSVKLLHCIYDARDQIFKDTDIEVNRAFMEAYIEWDVPEVPEARPMRIDGYFTNPVNPWRLEKNDDEVYGRGIGHLALSDIRGANELEAATITGIQKDIDPPMVGPSNMRARIRSDPGGQTFLDRSDYGSSSGAIYRELYSRSANWAAILEFSQEKKRALREWFAVDYFLQLSNLAKEGSPPTATQILGMADEKAILLMGKLGRFNSDGFDNLMRSSFYTEYSAGRLPPAPPQVLAKGGMLPSVNYLGPFAQAQRRMHSVRNMLNAAHSIGPFLEAFPKGVHKVRWPEAIERVLEDSGFPQELIVPKAEFDETITALAAQEQQIAQAKLLADVAKSVPSLQKKTDPTSPMAQLTGAP